MKNIAGRSHDVIFGIRVRMPSLKINEKTGNVYSHCYKLIWRPTGDAVDYIWDTVLRKYNPSRLINDIIDNNTNNSNNNIQL